MGPMGYPGYPYCVVDTGKQPHYFFQEALNHHPLSVVLIFKCHRLVHGKDLAAIDELSFPTGQRHGVLSHLLRSKTLCIAAHL